MILRSILALLSSIFTRLENLLILWRFILAAFLILIETFFYTALEQDTSTLRITVT
jgi:hypothetical protein